MPGPLLHVGAVQTCPHGGSGQIASTNIRVRVNNLAVATVTDLCTVAGCAFQIPIGTGTKPQPCVKVQWITPSLRVKVNGVPALLSTSAGLAQSVEQIPGGPPVVSVVQPRAVAT